jgi:hypothetical protein
MIPIKVHCPFYKKEECETETKFMKAETFLKHLATEHLNHQEVDACLAKFMPDDYCGTKACPLGCTPNPKSRKDLLGHWLHRHACEENQEWFYLAFFAKHMPKEIQITDSSTMTKILSDADASYSTQVETGGVSAFQTAKLTTTLTQTAVRSLGRLTEDSLKSYKEFDASKTQDSDNRSVYSDTSATEEPFNPKAVQPLFMSNPEAVKKMEKLRAQRLSKYFSDDKTFAAMVLSPQSYFALWPRYTLKDYIAYIGNIDEDYRLLDDCLMPAVENIKLEKKADAEAEEDEEGDGDGEGDDEQVNVPKKAMKIAKIPKK